MQPWFRMYHELLDDPKVQQLPDALFRHWVNLLCLACRNDGEIPVYADVSFAFRVDEKKAQEILQELIDRGLIDVSRRGVMRPHAWDSRQFKSDTSTARVKRFRKRFRNVSETLHETAQIQNRTDIGKNPSYILPLRQKPPSASTTTKTKIEHEFAVTEEMKTWAHSKGFTDEEIETQTPAMIDHFLSKAEKRADWVATWRNWMRTSRTFTRSGSPKARNDNGRVERIARPVYTDEQRRQDEADIARMKRELGK